VSKFALTSEYCGARRVLSLKGEVDVANADCVEVTLTRELDGGWPGEFLVDLSGLDFIDASGLHALIRVARHADVRRRVLTMQPPEDPVGLIFEWTNTDTLLPLAA
jgi:anti-sigma B factor antagonist